MCRLKHSLVSSSFCLYKTKADLVDLIDKLKIFIDLFGLYDYCPYLSLCCIYIHGMHVSIAVENAVRVCPMGANILCMTSLLKPLLQILATPKVTTGLRGQGQVKIKAGETLMMIQQRLKSGDVEHGQVGLLDMFEFNCS